MMEGPLLGTLNYSFTVKLKGKLTLGLISTSKVTYTVLVYRENYQPQTRLKIMLKQRNIHIHQDEKMTSE